MAIIPDKDREALRARFQEHLARPVRIVLFTRKSKLLVPGQDCPTCEDTERLMAEVAGLSDKLTLDVHDFYAEREMAVQMGVDKVPFLLFQADGERNVQFSGIPLGYEFATVVEALTSLGSGASPLKPKTVEAVQAINEEVRIQVFVTPG